MPNPTLPDDFPPIGYIFEHWLTTAQAAEKLGMSHQSVWAAIKHWQQDPKHGLRAAKIPTPGRGGGVWRIDPESVRRYHRRKPSGGGDSTDNPG